MPRSSPPSRSLPVSGRRASRLLAAASLVALAAMLGYLAFRVIAAVGPGYTTADRVMAALLLAADAFLCLHAVGFARSVVLASGQGVREPPVSFAPTAGARVAVLVAAYNEREEVLEQTIASVLAMDYPAFRLYLLDDSTRPECVEAGRRLADRYRITLVRRKDRKGYKAGAINDVLPTLDAPYVAVLDADQRPRQSWLKEVVPRLDADPRLAFVQAPQVYDNTRDLPVARTARYQQAVFFEYISEAKSTANAMYCCGSNVVLRREALLAIERVAPDGRRHFFDETSVTEDFATSLRLHASGWRSAYVNHTHVVGIGPETLAAYFTQQMRWATGTIGVGFRLLSLFARTPRTLSPAQWWEYLLSCSYYLNGLANAVFLLSPIAFLLFDVRPLRSASRLYLIVFLPYVAATVSLFFLGMRLRGHAVREVWLATVLSFGTFWTYVKAALVSLFGLRRAFGVTPKGVGGALPLSAMRVELGVLVASAAAAAFGSLRLFRFGADPAVLANTFWAAYNALLLAVLFLHFNRRVEVPSPRPLFEPAETAPAG